MRLDDFVCLGRTVPEDSKKYGRKVCMAGYSEELRGFLRVYPLPVQNPLRQRSVSRLELERPSHDNRAESWRLRREREDVGIECIVGEKPTAGVTRWLDGQLEPSIAALNANRRSLGVIRPEDITPSFRSPAEAVDPDEQSLFEVVTDLFGSETARLTPYLKFRDAGGWHDIQLREWGCYEWLRKEPARADQLWDNLALGRSDLDYYFVVGNMCNHRNVWLVISIYRAPKETSLFASCPRDDEFSANHH
jgi:hypothetical protein